MSQYLIPLSLIILGYLLGSIPFGFLLTKYVTGTDIRQTGSGNIGATNVLRSGRKGLAAATLLLDAFKGWLAVIIAMVVLNYPMSFAPHDITMPLAICAAALAALLGHIFPIWLKGKGGKGVATYLGVILGLSPLIFCIAAFIWISVFAITRISSLSALLAVAIVPVAWAVTSPHQLTATFSVLAGLLIIYRHKENIKRLLRKDEKPFGKA